MFAIFVDDFGTAKKFPESPPTTEKTEFMTTFKWPSTTFPTDRKTTTTTTTTTQTTTTTSTISCSLEKISSDSFMARRTLKIVINAINKEK